MKARTILITTLTIIAFNLVAQTNDYSSYLAQAWESLKLGKCDAAQRNYNVYKAMTSSKDVTIEKAIMDCQSKSDANSFVKGYIDLGLPSGTMWKDDNEKGYYTYEQAVRQFGNKLPTKKQFEELVSNCTWEWKGGGYMITGKNGNSIYLAAAGCIPWTLENQVCRVGDTGIYASGTPYVSAGSKDLYGLYFGREMIKVTEMAGANKISVRLIY